MRSSDFTNSEISQQISTQSVFQIQSTNHFFESIQIFRDSRIFEILVDISEKRLFQIFPFEILVTFVMLQHSHKIIQCLMHEEFQFWYTRYDSSFLRHPLIAPAAMLEELDFEQYRKMSWPNKLQPPGLGECFTFLEEFIKDTCNWQEGRAMLEEREEIQQNVNNIALMLLLEKNYAYNYWFHSQRRIQASVVHFFMLLFQLFHGILPSSVQTLRRAKKEGSLCVTSDKIELIINFVLERIKGIYKFMLKPMFKEQSTITRQFFTYIHHIITQLDKIDKTLFRQPQKLTYFISIVNPIQITTTNRKKAHTFDIAPKKKLKKNSIQFKSLDQPLESVLVRPKRYKSCANFFRRRRKQSSQQKSPTLFQFPNKDKSAKPKKKPTITTAYTTAPTKGKDQISSSQNQMSNSKSNRQKLPVSKSLSKKSQSRSNIEQSSNELEVDRLTRNNSSGVKQETLSIMSLNQPRSYRQVEEKYEEKLLFQELFPRERVNFTSQNFKMPGENYVQVLKKMEQVINSNQYQQPLQ